MPDDPSEVESLKYGVTMLEESNESLKRHHDDLVSAMGEFATKIAMFNNPDDPNYGEESWMKNQARDFRDELGRL